MCVQYVCVYIHTGYSTGIKHPFFHGRFTAPWPASFKPGDGAPGWSWLEIKWKFSGMRWISLSCFGDGLATWIPLGQLIDSALLSSTIICMGESVYTASGFPCKPEPSKNHFTEPIPPFIIHRGLLKNSLQHRSRDFDHLPQKTLA